MNEGKPSQQLEKARAIVARKVHELRRKRRWTQAELAQRLHVSQGRLSELERGAGSFTAEQFLTILRLFNVTVSDFVTEARDPQLELQNALARLGGSHLQETTGIMPSERLRTAGDVVCAVLVEAPLPRLISALAPVLVLNIDHVNLKHLHAQLALAGLERRLTWLVENSIEAVRRERPTASPTVRRLYGRAMVVLESFLDFVPVETSRVAALDVLDAAIRSRATLEEVSSASSSISQKWGIVTSLQPEDFVNALREARAGH